MICLHCHANSFKLDDDLHQLESKVVSCFEELCFYRMGLGFNLKMFLYIELKQRNWLNMFII